MCAQDAVALWQALLGKEKPPTVFVGHSMGGAIVTWAASRQVGSQPHACDAWIEVTGQYAGNGRTFVRGVPLLQPCTQHSWRCRCHPAHGTLGIAALSGSKALLAVLFSSMPAYCATGSHKPG